MRSAADVPGTVSVNVPVPFCCVLGFAESGGSPVSGVHRASG